MEAFEPAEFLARVIMHVPDPRRHLVRIYEVDPLVCPSCGGEMKVIAFITEHVVVDAKRSYER